MLNIFSDEHLLELEKIVQQFEEDEKARADANEALVKNSQMAENTKDSTLASTVIDSEASKSEDYMDKWLMQGLTEPDAWNYSVPPAEIIELSEAELEFEEYETQLVQQKLESIRQQMKKRKRSSETQSS